MSRRQRRPAPIPLCGALLVGVAALLSACSGGSAPTAAGAAAASAVMSSSSGSASSAASTAASTGAAGAASTPSAAAPPTAPAPPAGGPSRTSPAAPGSRTTTTTRPAIAAGAVNGRLVPNCRPAEFAQRAGSARGALQAYLFKPYAAGAMRKPGTTGALALLHGGQAVRFSTQQLVAARGLLATCPRPVGGVVQAIDDQVAALRTLWPTFAANSVPGATSVARVRSAQAATTAAATSARMPLAPLVPTAVQIQTG